MQKCPDCDYCGNCPHRMEHHLKTHGHGKAAKQPKKKEWKGNYPRKKKKKKKGSRKRK